MKLVISLSLRIGALVSFVSLSMGIIITMITINTQIESERNALLNVADLGSAWLNDHIHWSLDVLQELANRAQTRTMDWEIQSATLRVDIERTDYLDFGIVDKSGQAHYIKNNSFADLHDRDYIIRTLSGKQSISDVLISRVTSRSVIMYSVPITADDSINAPVLGALIGRKDGDHLSGIINTKVKHGKAGYAFLVNKTGTIIAHPDTTLVMQQFNPIEIAEQDPRYQALGDAVQTAIKSGEGIIEYVYKGKKLIAGYSAVSDFGWTLFVALEYAEYMAKATKMRNFLILLALVFLIIGISGSIILARSIIKSIQELDNPADARNMDSVSKKTESG